MHIKPINLIINYDVLRNSHITPVKYFKSGPYTWFSIYQANICSGVHTLKKEKTPDNKYSCSVMLSVGTSLVVSGWVAGYLMEQDLENILDRSVTNI